MTEQAGDIKQGFLWKQEHLAPLPIPTGQSASDLMNIIWRKNQAFLDIGSFAMGAGWLTLYMGSVLFIASAAYAAWGIGDYWAGFAVLGLLGGGIMGPLWYFYIKQWRKPLAPPIRFNRQRREVCITKPDGSYWFVPWEKVHAIAPSVTSLNTGGATRHGSLLLWFPLKGLEHKAYAPDVKGWILMVNPGGGISSMAQWECIRSFMEIGPDVVPEASVFRHRDMSIWQSYLFDVKQAAKDRGWFLALVWDAFLGEIIFNSILYDYFLRKKMVVVPDLTAPEVIEWSKPLPPEQWGKRSPELEQAILQREAELAVQV
ncbi:hypothetical protein AX279_07165 [Pseudomonas sp. J237]|nr:MULTISPECIES: hypothetical protein [Pseudomonas]OEO26581.1 hypothetical protein AX279_07165 [Pseudomonas sp. J237]